jgi:excisionase family DNA binding protein
MANVTPISQSVDFSDVMTTGETAKYLRVSPPTVRALTERDWHPLPCINTGNRTRKQRVFHRPTVMRWIQEEEQEKLA